MRFTSFTISMPINKRNEDYSATVCWLMRNMNVSFEITYLV
ncbi:hypothetical protein GCM10010217_75450 [Streptomyces tubercidicus]